LVSYKKCIKKKKDVGHKAPRNKKKKSISIIKMNKVKKEKKLTEGMCLRNPSIRHTENQSLSPAFS
jgi:hypothetical protein